MWLSVAIQCFLVALTQSFMLNKNHMIYENPFVSHRPNGYCRGLFWNAGETSLRTYRYTWRGFWEVLKKQFHISTCLYLCFKIHDVLYILCFIFAKHFTMNFGTCIKYSLNILEKQTNQVLLWFISHQASPFSRPSNYKTDLWAVVWPVPESA